MPIRKVQFRRLEHLYPIGIQRRHRGDDVLELAAVGARVHHHATAERTGNAMGEFQPRQAAFPCEQRELGKRHARIRCDLALARQLDV